MVNVEKIKREAEKFREENGNSEIQADDMLFYIVNRIDALPCEPHMALMSELSGKLKVLLPITLAGFAALSGLMYFLLG